MKYTKYDIYDCGATWESKISTNRKRLKVKIIALIRQKGQCSICRTPLLNPREAHYDHCHKSGEFRAVLCPACNQGLGKFKDNPTLLRNAALYLELHS